MAESKLTAPILSQNLLLGVAEELKLPLLQIAHQAEQLALDDQPAPGLKSIQATADSALRLLDNYVLGVRLALAPAELPIGIVTAFLGAPFFLYLLLRGRT